MSRRPKNLKADERFRLIARSQIVRRELAKVEKQINHLRKKIS